MNIIYMSLSAKSKQTLLDTLYYGETTQFTSIKSCARVIYLRN